MSAALKPIVIVGPTGVGKTRVAIELAHALGGELVGADSVQVYRGFDIGAAKPTREELGDLTHHLIDVVAPDDAFDAARYATLAHAAIEQITARGHVPIVVGGTGLWLRALLRGLVSVPAVDPALRAELERSWDETGAVAMHARLARVDTASAARIHVNDKLRVVRALEVYEQTGQPLGALRAEHALGSSRYDDLTIVVDVPIAHHGPAVLARTERMFELGFADEVAGLLRRYGRGVRALGSVGYKQVVEELEHALPRTTTLESIVRATSVYARRQRTWWKSDPSVKLRVTPEQALGAELRARIASHVR